MVHYKFTYFPLQGRGETIRMILNLARQPYENVAVDQKGWPAMKPNTPFGSVPVLEVDGVQLAQTIAIARYLGETHGLAGKDPYENYLLNMWVDASGDMWTLMGKSIATLMRGEMDAHKEARTSLYAPDGPFNNFAKRFEAYLQKKGTDYITGNTAKWADAHIADWLIRLLKFDEHCLENYPTTKAYLDRFSAIPQIKEYLAKRPNTPC